MKKSLVIVFSVLLLSGCKKDWGIQNSEKYQSVDGPEQYWDTKLKINLSSTKTSLNLDDNCYIDAVVERMIIKENGDTVSVEIMQPSNFLFKWEIFNFECSYYYLVGQLRSGFRINNRTQVEAIGVNKIVFSIIDYQTMQSYFMPSGSWVTMDDVLFSIKKINIKCTVRDANSQMNDYNNVIGIDFKK